MKLIIALMLIFSTQISMAKNCQTDASYSKQEWKITYPNNFNSIYKDLQRDLSQGIMNKEITKDLDGTIVTSQGYLNRIYMHTRSWDTLSTPQKEMFGDIAIFTNRLNEDEILEIRWFENGVKHIAVNSKYLECVSISAPFPENTIF